MKSTFTHSVTVSRTVSLRVETVTNGGSMPDDFEEAADYYLDTKTMFADEMMDRLMIEADRSPEGDTWGLASRTYRTHGHSPATCSVIVVVYVGADVDADELDDLAAGVLKRIIDRRLKPVFRRDRQDCRRAIGYVRRKERRRPDAVERGNDTLAPDVDTHEHVLDEPGLRLVS